MKASDSDSPIVGALTLNYLSYGLLAAVNNLWSWLTVVAASCRFWNVRALSSSPTPPKPEDRAAAAAVEDDFASAREADPAVDSKKHLAVQLIAPSSPPSFCEGDSPKVKFSVYYKEAEYECSGNGEREEDSEEEERHGRMEAAVVEKVVGRRWWSECEGGDWERRMVVRMGDMGWYACQDLRVLNGSVVRLWETPRRPPAAEVNN